MVYADTSWLIDRRARGLPPRPSTLGGPTTSTLLTSDLTVVEVGRVLRRQDANRDWTSRISSTVESLDMMSVSASVVALAAHLPIQFLRSLDAIHLASALLARSALVLTLDGRLASACREFGLETN